MRKKEEEIVKPAVSFRILNALGKPLEKVGIFPGIKTADNLKNEASRLTGLSDWGDADFENPLSILLKSLREEAQLSPFGKILLNRELVKALSNRLLVENELKRHPEFLGVKIDQPIINVSLPRTGSTFLHRLLSQDTATRTLLFWEAYTPAPMARTEITDTDLRILEAERMLNNRRRGARNINRMHSMNANDPEECYILFLNTFTTAAYSMRYHIPGYTKWLDSYDMIEGYNYYKKQLQILQRDLPDRRWILKTGYHLYALDSLTTVFPDAYIIHNHRNPCKSIPSLCSLVTTIRSIFSNSVDLNRVGRFCLDEWARALNKSIAVRDALGSERFIDVGYGDLLKEPLGVVRKIYEHTGLYYSAESESRMQKWINENPQNKLGVHKYSLEQFGLTQEMIEDRFKEYYRRFGEFFIGEGG
jgi:hypothetical protein